MSVLWAVFLGIIQGAAEFLPVSSSGHLSIIQNIFGINSTASNFTFDILLHLGTLAAVFIVYWKEIFDLIPAFFAVTTKIFCGRFKLCKCTDNERFVIMLLLASLPLVLVVFIKDYIESIASYTKIIGIFLVLNGLILLVSDKIVSGKTNISNTSPHNAVSVGFFQLLAVLPGISRSGMTITGGLFQGFSREYAVKFSFILSIPAILGANIFSISDIFKTSVPSSDIIAYICGTAAAAVTGILSMKLLQYISKRSNFRFFSIYCFAIGIAAIIFG